MHPESFEVREGELNGAVIAVATQIQNEMNLVEVMTINNRRSIVGVTIPKGFQIGHGHRLEARYAILIHLLPNPIAKNVHVMLLRVWPAAVGLKGLISSCAPVQRSHIPLCYETRALREKRLGIVNPSYSTSH